MFSSWLVAATILAGGPPASRLADIGPAPRTDLVDSAGKPFNLAKLRGKVVLVSFIYTTCNGVCPATTQRLVRVQDALKDAKVWGTSVEFVSITLDPRRDTPEVLREYARLFGADSAAWHFLTGPPANVESVITAWGMWVKTVPSGSLDHPSRIFLLDPLGRQREIYNLEFLQPSDVLKDVQSLVRATRPMTNQQNGLRARRIEVASG
jgi:protein SCO1/2